MENINKNRKKFLNTVVQRDVVVFNTYAFPLCLIEADSAKSEWIYEHFSQIIVSKEESGYTNVDFLENDIYGQVLLGELTSFDEIIDVKDIVEYLKNRIEEGYQPVLVIDYDCIKEKRISPYPHFFIQIYIYGYDDETQEFSGIGFRSDYQFDKLKYSYQEVRDAFASMVKHNKHDIDWVDRFTVSSLKLINPGEKYECSKDLVLKKIHGYFYSKNGIDEIRIEDKSEQRLSTAKFGLEAQKEVISALKKLLDNDFVIDFRAIHLLKEHKDLMYKKLQYLFPDEKEDLDKYKKICNKLGQARLMYMMQVEIDSQFLYGQLKNKDVINRICTILEEITVIEEEVLKSLIK